MSTKNNHSLPHVQSLLRRCISSSERYVISGHLEEAQKELRSREIEINKLKADLLMLENERDQLKNRVETFRALLAPVHRLPTELLASILKYAAECGDIHEQITPTEAPRIVTLSMVCSRWREITLSTPSLWSFISLWLFDWIYKVSPNDDDEGFGDPKYEFKGVEEISRLKRILQLFLKRSQTTQLDIRLRLTLIQATLLDYEASVIRSVLEVLVPTASRWKSLNIDLPEDLSSDVSALSLLQNLSSLQHLDLPLPWHGPHVEGCPSVTSVRLGMATGMLLIPWHQVRTLHFTGFGGSVEQALDTVRSCSGVEDLTLECAPLMVNPPAIPPIVSPCLTSLTLREFQLRPRPGRTSAFRLFSLPQLSTLTLWADEVNMDIRDFSDFLYRSSCTITHLTIQSSYMGKYGPKENEDTIIAFLRLLPTLKVLCLKEKHAPERHRCNKLVSRTLLRRLSAHRRCYSDSPFLPHLSELTLSVYGKKLDTEALIEAVASRWLQAESNTGITRLQSLNLELIDKSSPTLESLHYLRRAGLKVEIFGC
ncbi:hypothetical protein AAF712_002425 [Marasmius tenuissimus]|uniref:F-box domain-containing protein n=1 Tax=Marasmius tenuissimus TaxID=585030 RepID=A0ABR3A9K7_9AGAR